MEDRRAIETVRYSSADRDAWDAFIDGSKNGTFLFKRRYMEYHSDRFTDHSLIFRDGDGIVAVMPANLREGSLESHGGLTFGGIVSGAGMSTSLMLDIFHSMVEHLKGEGIGVVTYKAVPHIYHRLPADEDMYALFRSGARLVRRDIGSAVYRPGWTEREMSRLRMRGVKKAQASGLKVERSYDFKAFMKLQSEVLNQRYGAAPVHTPEEMSYLAESFPDNIKLFAAGNGDGSMVAGAIVYEHDTVAHVQYNANSVDGREIGGGDIIYGHLINEVYRGKKYFDFGTSNRENGMQLNEGLIAYKESYGARAVAHDFYELVV